MRLPEDALVSPPSWDAVDGRLHDRRQAYYGADGYQGTAESGIADFTIHARVLGLDPTMPDELITSMIFAMLFGGLVIGVYFQLYRKMWFRSIGTYTLGAGAFLLFLGFAIRAGIANSSDPTRVSFIVECICFALGELFVLDHWIMRVRDDYLNMIDVQFGFNTAGGDFQSNFRSVLYTWESRIALLSRFILLPLSAILYIVGFVELPDPAVDIPPYKSTEVRGVASFIPVFVILIIMLLLLWTRMFADVPLLNVLWSAGIGALLFVPAVYAFGLVAVTLDSSPMVSSHVFFNIAFGLCHLLAIAGLIGMTAFPFWKHFAQEAPPVEGGPPPPPMVPPRAPPYFWLPRGSADQGMRHGPRIPQPAPVVAEVRVKPPKEKPIAYNYTNLL